MSGRLGKAAGLLPRGAAGERQGQGEGTGGLAASAQQPAELDDQAEEGGADGSAIERVLCRRVADGGGGGQVAGDDGTGVDAAGPVRGLPAGLAAQQALDRVGPPPTPGRTSRRSCATC
ncbi:hypothetical protein AQJ11_37900 [Streptomyces corchorusii]|uniref:Uncharacterized protein n=1 Tax=Streptomyces corchorusii TaxID=1903 RepID=A0A117QAG9_STRCK|nr:hypothetical protein AQJ11_37900 [Streptomyces corchorusii]